jgi:hypothetical protein
MYHEQPRPLCARVLARSWCAGFAEAQALWPVKPNEPERRASSKRTRARGGIRTKLAVAFPERIRRVRSRTNPTVRVPNEPERDEIQTSHTTILVGDGALDWWKVP